MIVTETARVLASQEFLPSTLDQHIQQIVYTTVFPDMPYPQERNTRQTTVVSSLTKPLTQAAKDCQISAQQYQQQHAKKKKRKP